MAENANTNWNEIGNNCLNEQYDFATLSDEMLIKCMFLMVAQINAFTALDNGNTKLEYRDGTAVSNTENTFLEIANMAKKAHELMIVLQHELNSRDKTIEYIDSTLDTIYNEYVKYEDTP
jgi:hypothetical protein